MRRARARHLSRALTLVVLMLGFALRLSWSLTITPRQLSDARTYARVALELAAGDGYRDAGMPTAYYPIGYPALLAVVHRVFGEAPDVARIANAVLGTMTIAAVYILALALTQSRAAAFASMSLLAFYPADIAFTSVTLSQAPFNTLALTGCALAIGGVRRGWVKTLAAGVLLAWAMLTRHQGVVLIPLILAAWVLQRRWHWYWKGDCALFVCAFLAAATPWAIRNAIELQAFVPISTNGGINLYIGNNPRATGRYTMSPKIMAPLTAAVPGGRHGGRNEVLFDRKASQLAWAYAKREPRAALALWPRKLTWLYAKDDGFDYWLSKLPSREQGARVESLRRVSEPYYLVLVALGVIGAVLSFASLIARRRTLASLIWFPAAVVFAFSGLHMLTFGSATYHHPMMPWVAISAGYALTVLSRGVWVILLRVRRTLGVSGVQLDD